MLADSASEIIATATVSFFLGWTFKKYQIGSIIRNFRNLSSYKTKLVIVVRSDLPMSKGKIASQCSHAAVSCFKEGLSVCPDVVKKWELNGQPKIILKTSSGEEGLRNLAQKAANAGLVTALIRDAGLTEITRGCATAVGIGPGCADKINEITAGYKTL